MFTALRGAAVAVVAGALLATATASPAAARPLVGPTLEEGLPVYSVLAQVLKKVVQEPQFLPLLVLKQ
ncbi:MAG: hypothetical protein HOV96_41920 [Nonomuraea sp.]|nr:hypothetical protein [Nonomuraea sp.]NUP84105.1 hypothetical protein [Nonomuraea sp.]NUS01613.1 hypothetical protein [Nonomuraea sp.]